MILQIPEEYRQFYNSSSSDCSPIFYFHHWSVPEATSKVGLYNMSPEEMPILIDNMRTKEKEPWSCIFQSSAAVKAFRDLQELVPCWSVSWSIYTKGYWVSQLKYLHRGKSGLLTSPHRMEKENMTRRIYAWATRKTFPSLPSVKYFYPSFGNVK